VSNVHPVAAFNVHEYEKALRLPIRDIFSLLSLTLLPSTCYPFSK
jgi:hypothetical protein